MIDRTMAAESMPTPTGGPVKSGSALQPRRRIELELADERHQNEDAPEAVNDGRNRREQFGQEHERFAQPLRARVPR